MIERVAHLHPELLRRLAHHIRGSVAVVLGALDEADRSLGPADAPARPFLRMAMRGGRRTLRIADALQQTAALAGGNVEWVKRPVDLWDLLAVAAGASERREARDAVRIVMSRAGGASTVTADAGWLLLAFEEVLGNAVRYARRVVTAHVESSDGVVRVTITDDGTGFSSPPSRRTDRVGAGGGVGLSLPMVVKVLAAHGATLELGQATTAPGPDEPNPGARVAMTFPIVAATAANRTDAKVPSAGQAGAPR